MSYQEYSDELYEAFDKVKDAFWYDDVVDEIETIMWYAGLTEEFKNSDKKEWYKLLRKAQDILKIF